MRDIIDLHSHYFPPAVLDLLAARETPPRIMVSDGEGQIVFSVGALPLGRQWHDIDHRLEHLERNVVAHQLISWPTTLNLEPVLPIEEARHFWRTVNDGYGELVRRHPRRFSALAVLSTADIAWSLEELRRAHGDLGLIGFVLPINCLASGTGAAHLAPLFAEAQRLRAHIYLHTGYGSAAVPGQPAPVTVTDAPALSWTLAVLHHFSAAFATVALTDALDDYPDVTVQIAMLGGAGAAALLAEQAEIFADRLGGPPHPARLGRLFLDTGAAGQGPAAIGLSTDVFGAERIVFGSDYAPAPDIAPVIEHVHQAPISTAARDAIFTANARSLLARHGVAVEERSGGADVRV